MLYRYTCQGYSPTHAANMYYNGTVEGTLTLGSATVLTADTAANASCSGKTVWYGTTTSVLAL